MTVEIEERKIDALNRDLKRIINLNDFHFIKSDSNKEKTVLLKISFTKGTGNLEIDIPSVPG